MVDGLVSPKYSNSFQMMVGGLFMDNLLEKKLIISKIAKGIQVRLNAFVSISTIKII